MKTMRPTTEHRQGLRSLLDYTSIRSGVLVEIGCYSGESTEIFALSGRFHTILAVDPWPIEDVRAAFEARMRPHLHIVHAVRCRSPGMADNVADHYTDLVYIDGEHGFESVDADIRAWLPKVRPGGWMAGHDYMHGYPGVVQAVHVHFHRPYRVFEDGSWLVKIHA